jgi:hypothetical protein
MGKTTEIIPVVTLPAHRELLIMSDAASPNQPGASAAHGFKMAKSTLLAIKIVVCR